MSDDDYEVNPPLPPRYRFRDVFMADFSVDDERRFDVEFFTNERSLKERLQLYFIKNQRSSLRIRVFNLSLKLLTFILYVIRVYLESAQGPTTNCYYFETSDWLNCSSARFQSAPRPGNTTETDITTASDSDSGINWLLILWVNRNPTLWCIQVTVAIISLLQAGLMMYLGYKGNIIHLLLSLEFVLEMACSLPFFVSIFDSRLRFLFIPVFLNLWLAKNILESMFNDVHRVMNKSQSPLSQQLTVLISTIVSIFLISACGIQHLQRAGTRHLTLFEAIWFVVVSFSTVGYGDITPDIWPSQLFMMVMIITSLLVLPAKLEKLAFTWVERTKKGGSYSRHRAETEKHVVVCATHLHTDTVMDFLNEFYAHPKLQGHYVVLLSPSELDDALQSILQIPIWAQRVIYIKGSALKDSDLQRCRMSHAFGCFILASRNQTDRQAADEHTILRSWAIRDHSPNVKQYIQLFKPESKFHVRFARHVVCEDELKYALLAYNCVVPGTSSLVTLLLHTSRGTEGDSAFDDWQKIYGRCSGNEIYEIKLSNSRFYGDYIGKSFCYASFHAHKKFGVCLMGIQCEGLPIQINPGPRYNLRETDTLFYMSITKEEHSSFSQKAEDMEKSREPIMRQGKQMVQMVAKLGTATVRLSDQHSLSMIEAQTGPISAHITSSSSASSQLSPDTGNGMRERRPSIAAVAELVTDTPESPEQMSDNFVAVDLMHNQESLDSVGELPGKSIKFSTMNHQPDVESPTSSDPLWNSHSSGYQMMVDVPPVAPYIGKGFHLCYLLSQPRPLCCLRLAKKCDHCSFQHAREYSWANRAIILASDNCSNGLYNFILPLRNHRLRKSELRPIVLLLESEPDRHFKECVRHFPMVYWIQGSINKLDDWLRAGVNYADNVVVVNMETSNSSEDEYLSDCNTIVAVQTLFRLFPSAKIITELSQSSNMRFMQFKADDSYSLRLSKLEKEVKRKGSHMSYMFRLPFSAGAIFSASMLDTLLYQAFVKEYLIEIVRLLLGINQGDNSGYLSCMHITKEEADFVKTYGRLYQKLCSSSGSIPIGIYRTQDSGGSESRSMGSYSEDSEITEERLEIAQLVQGCMKSLNLPPEAYDENQHCRSQRDISYVVINPPHDLPIEEGCIVYVIKPATKVQSQQFQESRRKSQYGHRRVKPSASSSIPTIQLSVDEPDEETTLIP